MSAPAGWYPDETNGGERYWDGEAWTEQRRTTQAVAVPAATQAAVIPSASVVPATAFNQVHGCLFRSGWPAWLAGENQEKALMRVVPGLNASGRRVVAITPDRWSIWKRLLWALILVVTLGIVGRSPGVVIVTEPLS